MKWYETKKKELEFKLEKQKTQFEEEMKQMKGLMIKKFQSEKYPKFEFGSNNEFINDFAAANGLGQVSKPMIQRAMSVGMVDQLKKKPYGVPSNKAENRSP